MNPQIKFSHWIEPEDQDPEDFFASGDDAADREDVQRIREQLRDGNEAAWCVAFVVAEIRIAGQTFMGRVVVGGMSWPSERELWEEMLTEFESEAVDDLLNVLRKYAENVQQVLVALDALLEKYG